MRFCTWNVRSMYRAGLLTAVTEEVSKHKLGWNESLGRPRRKWVDDIKMDLKRDRMG
jgi:hypothetical protein